MTTAGRPTFAPAAGGSDGSQGGHRVFVSTRQVSSKDLKAHSTLKLRQPGQQTEEEIATRDLKQELLERERKSRIERGLETKTESEREEEKILPIEEKESKSEVLEKKIAPDIDADDSDDSDDSSDDESDDEDETEALMRELEKIKKEREEEAQRREEEKKRIEDQEREEEFLKGNPLTSAAEDFNVRKRWYDDAVFKNQTRGEVKQPKRFVNDTIRNDFHRKFLHKYIQ